MADAADRNDPKPPEMAMRAGHDGDHPFVRESWLQSDKHSLAGRDEGEGYMRRVKGRINAILARAELRIVCDRDSPEAILGWAVVAKGIVYYVYVRPEVRRLNIAKTLVADMLGEAATYTHRPVIRGPLPIPKLWHYDRTPNYA